MAEQLIGGFWVHITEFIKRMKIVLATFIVAVLVILVLPANSDFFATTDNYSPLIKVFLDYIRNLILPSYVKLFAASASDPITLYVLASVVFGLGFTMPVFAYEAYKFISPALYVHEKKAIFPFVSVVTVLFIAGAVFGFFFLLPSFVQGLFPFFKMLGAEPWLSIMDFYNIVFFTILISGLIFTIPAFFVLLVKFGVIHTKMFAKKRKYVYIGLVVVSMLVSPTATPIGDLYLFVALAALFEVSMFAGRRYEPASDSNSTPAIMKLFSAPKCRYCQSDIEGNSHFCPSCRRLVN